MDSIWEYYVAVNPKILTIAIGILFTLAVCTIGFMVTKVSIRKPVESLRYE
jgi:hypothetical protein